MNLQISSVKNDSLQTQIVNHLNDLTKPIGSLGRLEEFALQYCLCRGTAAAKINKMSMYTFAGDHGITTHNICPFPKVVTCQMANNILSGGAAISVLCKNAGIKYYIVDIGIDGEFKYSSNFINKKVAHGTSDFYSGAAMSSIQCEEAINHGRSLAKKEESDLIGIGELGIGNSSSASAIYSMLLSIDANVTVGPGTGSAGEMLKNKKDIIKKAVEKHLNEWDGSPFDALCRVGGFEIAGMVGMILGAAESKVPVVVDGFISGSAALVAMKMNSNIKDYLFFSHASAESFHKDFLKNMGIRPILELDMRLGEGTGAALAMQIISQSLHCYNEMATFSGAGVDNAI